MANKTHQQHIESATKKAEQNLELINKLQLALLALEIRKGKSYA